MESNTYFIKTINNIEQNISEKINVEKLSSECFISPRQLYRDFYSLTGHSINEYIRKRKLSKALSLLKFSDISIFDIAYICGYSSVQALYRSIKSSLNLTPTEYRNGTDIFYFPLYDGVKTKQITVKSLIIPETINVKFYHTKLVGIEDRAISYLLSIIPECAGRLYGKNGTQSGNRFCYELYIEYDEVYKEKLTSAFNEITTYPGYTAVFACTSSVNREFEINSAWDFLYGQWLQGSMFEQDNIPYFEEYIIKGNNIKKLILHLPVRPRENFYKINVKSFEDRIFLTATKKGIDAEMSASNTVIDLLAEHYPLYLKTQKEFFISKKNNIATCGLNIKTKINFDNNTVKVLTIPKGLYAVLEGSCYGSGNEYEQILTNWLRDNGFEIMGTPFSIYDTSKGTGHNQIIVKSQVLIKDGRI